MARTFLLVGNSLLVLYPLGGGTGDCIHSIYKRTYLQKIRGQYMNAEEAGWGNEESQRDAGSGRERKLHREEEITKSQGKKKRTRLN